jgi:hypothetical protein
MRVFLAFASALCKLGSKRLYEIRDIDPQCRRFLLLLTSETYKEKVWPNRGPLALSGLLRNAAEKLGRFEGTPEWEQYRNELTAAEDKLLADLDREASQPPVGEDEIDLPELSGFDLNDDRAQDGRGPETDRSVTVDEFLMRCNNVPGLGEKILRKHIWMSVGHKYPRQFQYWQSCDPRATGEDDKNFSRKLAMRPVDFVAELQRMKLLSKKF